MKIKANGLLAMIVLCCLGSRPADASVFDLAGHWSGTIEAGKFKIRILLKITKEGDERLTAAMDMVDQGARNIPIAAVLYNEPDVRLEFDQFNTVFHGALSPDRNEIRGRFEEGPGGKPTPVNFKRVSQNAAPAVAKTYTFEAGEQRDIRGYWKATLQPVPDMVLRVGLKIGRRADGGFEALMDSLDQGAQDIPASSVVVTNGQAKLEWEGLQLVFDAQLEAEGNKLSGTWKQGPTKPMEVTFRRLDKPATALPDNLSFEPDGAGDPRGHWEGTLQDTGRDFRMIFKIGRAPDGTYAGAMSVPDQGGMEFPLTQIGLTNSNLHIELKMMRATFTGSFTNQGKAITGQWEQMSRTLPLTLERK